MNATVAPDREIDKVFNSIAEVKDEILYRIEMEKRFNSMLMWVIVTMMALIGIVVAILKLSR